MSASTINRWNAIPLSRPEHPESISLKRPRPEDTIEHEGIVNTQDDDDDDISLVSRSPSPDAMDVDPSDPSSLGKYDEYVRGAAREVITVETPLKSTNKGFAMLAKLGWAQGMPLGLSGDGRVDPIPFQMKADSTGLGKLNQDVRMIETTVSQRRELDSERQVKETEEQRRAREDAVHRASLLTTEISSTLSPFYCSLCSKQFKNVAQYDEHTNSYAHHHKARFRDMQVNAKGLRGGDAEEADRRKEKERKREEKELRRIAKASGVKITKPATVGPAGMVALPASDSATTSGMDVDTPPPAKSGWGAVSTSSAEPPSNSGGGGGFKKSGWATVGSSALPPSSGAPPPPPSHSHASASASASTSTAPPGQQQQHYPAFRTGGWTSLETGSSQPDTHAALIPLPPSPPPSRGGWGPVTSAVEPSRPQPPPQQPPTNVANSSASRDGGRGGGGWSSVGAAPPQPSPQKSTGGTRGGLAAAPPSHSQHLHASAPHPPAAVTPMPASTSTPLPLATPPTEPKSKSKAPSESKAQASRQGWQKFQNSKRK